VLAGVPHAYDFMEYDFTELLRLTKNADTDRPEIRAAKQAVAAR
jgi:hypothetical protein